MWADARTVMAELIVRSLGMNGERRLVAFPCLSVRACLCPHVSLWLSLTDLLRICCLRLTKICQIPNLVKIEKQYVWNIHVVDSKTKYFSRVKVQRERIVALQ